MAEATLTKLDQKPFDYYRPGWGIMTASGVMCSDKVFDDPKNAVEYLKSAWGSPRQLPKGYRIVRATLTVTPVVWTEITVDVWNDTAGVLP